jgi:transposase
MRTDGAVMQPCSNTNKQSTGVIQEGAAFIIHKNRGRKPKHAVPDKTRDSIIELKQTKYEEANFKHFQELLEKYEEIQVSYSTVHRILIEAGIKSPQKS